MKAPSLALVLLGSGIVMADPVAELAGLQVVYDSGEKEFDGFRTFNSEQGHKVALMIRSKAKPIVGYDEDKAALTIGGAKAESAFFMGDSSFSEDKKTLRLEFDTEEKAQPNAKGEIELKGKISVSVASTKGEIRSTAFPVKAGEAIAFPADQKGLPILKVKKSGKPDFGDKAFAITFSTNMKMDNFAGVKFLTKDGKEVESEKGSTSSMTFNNNYSGTIEYEFATKHEELIMILETWTDKEEKIIEVDLKASLAGK